MNLNELANLSLVRSHLAMLINNRATMPKDQVKEAGYKLADLDKLFIEKVLALNVEKLNPKKQYVLVQDPPVNKTTVVKVTDNTVTVEPVEESSPQLELDLAPKAPSTKAKKSKSQDPTEEEKALAARAEETKAIAERVAQAKKEVSSKKKASSFKRAD